MIIDFVLTNRYLMFSIYTILINFYYYITFFNKQYYALYISNVN